MVYVQMQPGQQPQQMMFAAAPGGLGGPQQAPGLGGQMMGYGAAQPGPGGMLYAQLQPMAPGGQVAPGLQMVYQGGMGAGGGAAPYGAYGLGPQMHRQ